MVAYPAALEREADGGYVATFRDVPEAGDVLDQALDAGMYSMAVVMSESTRSANVLFLRSR